jgi:ParB-like nuclease domain
MSKSSDTKTSDINGGGNGGAMIFEEIMLHKPPPLRIQFKKVPTDKVNFDPENPRLRYLKKIFPDKTDKSLIFEKDDTKYLLKDIQEKGVIDPIYVKPAGNGFWQVTEGNRRTAVMKELRERHPDNPAFAFIPARVLPPDTTPEQEALLMASFHVAGKIKWEAHEKAGHIWSMINELRIPEAELITTLHMGSAAIKKASESYGLLKRFQQIENGKYADKAEGKWSFFAEMLKVKDFYAQHKGGQDFGDRFCHWVGEGRIPRAEDVRDLEDILSKGKAREIFYTEPPGIAFEKARKEVDKSKPSRNSKFFKDLERLVDSGKSASLNDLEAASGNDVARDTVNEAYAVIVAFMERAGMRVPGTRR